MKGLERDPIGGMEMDASMLHILQESETASRPLTDPEQEHLIEPEDKLMPGHIDHRDYEEGPPAMPTPDILHNVEFVQPISPENETNPYALTDVSFDMEEASETPGTFSSVNMRVREHAHSLINRAREGGVRYRIGLARIDEHFYGPARDEVCYLAGATHTGKTTVLIATMHANNDVPTVFFSLEDKGYRIVEKQLAYHYKRPMSVLLDVLESGDEEAISKVAASVEQVDNHYNKLAIVHTGSGTFEYMTRSLEQYELIWGERPKLVLIDSFARLRIAGQEDMNHDWGSSKIIAERLQQWAEQEHVAVIVVTHTNKGDGKSWVQPHEGSLRNISVDDADSVIALWTPFRNPDLPDKCDFTPTNEERNEIWFVMLKDKARGAYFPHDDRVRYSIQDDMRMIPIRDGFGAVDPYTILAKKGKRY